jgi:hypothetical protein
MEFIAFGQTEIDIGAILDADGGDSEWNGEALDPNIEGDVRLRANRADGSQVRDSVSRADPELGGSVVGCLKEENSVILVPT